MGVKTYRALYLKILEVITLAIVAAIENHAFDYYPIFRQDGAPLVIR